MAVEIDQVEAFVAIVRRGGFTRAAAALHLSQPAVSRRLELLEREVGRPLFDRTRGGARLTEAGRTFLPHAEALLASMRDGVEAVQALNRADRGTVTLALVGTLASTTLTARLRKFRHTHPHVRLALRTALSREVTALVRRGDAALGLRYFPDPDPDVVSLPLYKEALVPVCARSHRLACARRPNARMLAGETWVAFAVRPVAAGESYAQMLTERLATLGARRCRDHPDRQPHRAEAAGRGRLRPGTHAGEQRRGRAARRHAPRAAHRGHAHGGAGRAGAPAPRVPERRRASTHGAPRRTAEPRALVSRWPRCTSSPRRNGSAGSTRRGRSVRPRSRACRAPAIRPSPARSKPRRCCAARAASCRPDSTASSTGTPSVASAACWSSVVTAKSRSWWTRWA